MNVLWAGSLMVFSNENGGQTKDEKGWAGVVHVRIVIDKMQQMEWKGEEKEAREDVEKWVALSFQRKEAEKPVLRGRPGLIGWKECWRKGTKDAVWDRKETSRGDRHECGDENGWRARRWEGESFTSMRHFPGKKEEKNSNTTTLHRYNGAHKPGFVSTVYVSDAHGDERVK